MNSIIFTLKLWPNTKSFRLAVLNSPSNCHCDIHCYCRKVHYEHFSLGFVHGSWFQLCHLNPISCLSSHYRCIIRNKFIIRKNNGVCITRKSTGPIFINAFGYSMYGQADTYISNLKFAFYGKIGLQDLCQDQLIMVFLQKFINLGVLTT